MNFNFSDRMQNLSGNAIREIFHLLSKPEIISFAGGLPANEGLPLSQIRHITNDILSSNEALSVLQYGATEGYRPLREIGIEYLNRAGISNQNLDNIIAVTGGQQGIDLMCKAFLNKDDVILVEEPTYLAVLHIIKTYQAKPIGIKSGEDGLDLEDLEDKIKKHNPKLLYLVPTFANPTGRTLSIEKRQRIAEICGKYSLVLLEDDPYCELRYEGQRVPSIKSFDTAERVVYLLSFSKTISPGLRTAVAVGNKEIIRKLTLGKQGTDAHTSSLSQAIVYQYLKNGYMDPHLHKTIPLYKEKRDRMLMKMEECFPADINFTRPQGGLFIWVTLPEYMNANNIFMTAIKNNVAFVSGQSFYPGENVYNTLRLNFSNATFNQIDLGIERLAAALKENLKE